MVKYKKIFLDFWGLTIADFIPCINCGSIAVDLHHLIFKSQGGKDLPENLAPICRNCHNRAHSDKVFNNYLKELHEDNIERFTQNKLK
jgi:5-methylcytosine-specific restriction endonuclease McrA